MADRVDEVRAACLSLPGVSERPSHGAPAFFVGRQFLQLWPEGHHEHDFAHLWCAAAPGAQAEHVARLPGTVFRPPYVGGRGWIGVRLDGALDPDELELFCRDAYRAVAPARLLARLED